MWAENGYYGHRMALQRHAGLRLARPIPGRLQHGWQPGPGHPPTTFADPGLHLVWSSRNVTSAAAAGHPGVLAIGAPWLYAGPLDGTRPLPEPGAGQGVLAMPFHGWERAKVHGDFERYADALLELQREQGGPVTVCMYWAEHADASLRGVFEARGFRTVTAGAREDNPVFLDTLRALIREHRLVTSNRIATATFYALAAGRDFLLHGPVMGLAGTDDADGSRFDAWQRETFPELTADGFGSGDAARERRRAIGLAELGAEHLLAPAALRERLLWQPGQLGAYATVLVQRQLGRLRRALA